MTLIQDTDEADLSGFMNLEFALSGAVSMESFALQADKESKVLPGYDFMLSVAAFSAIPLLPQ